LLWRLTAAASLRFALFAVGLFVESAGALFGQQADFSMVRLKRQGDIKRLVFFNFDVGHVKMASREDEKRKV